MDYDVIVIGAGNGGLVAANRMCLDGKKVLLLDRQQNSGGMATSFVRGRFEFDTMVYPIIDYGSGNYYGNLKKLFKDLDIENKVEVVGVQDAFRVLATEPELVDYTMPFGIDAFINKMEDYVPGSRNAMVTFFELAREIRDAMAYLNLGKSKFNYKVFKKNYSNFMRVSSYSVKDVFYAIEMPLKAQMILNSCWLYLGASESELSFVHYALMLLNYIEGGVVVPKLRSYDFNLTLEEKLRENGGVIRHNVEVEEILVNDGKVTGVKLTNGKVCNAKVVIANISPSIVIGKMIKNVNLSSLNALVNTSEVGAKEVTVYLGLNRSKEELGIRDYLYFIYHSLNSDEEYQKLLTIDNDTLVATCLNKAIPNCSPDGTTILTLSTLYFGDCFDKEVTVENYFDLKNALASKLIERFETTTGIRIKDFIEEIEVATPVSYVHYLGSYNGSTYGYRLKKNDNLLDRLLSIRDIPRIDGLYFCGSNGVYGSGFTGSYFSGDLAYKMALEKMNEVK